MVSGAVAAPGSGSIREGSADTVSPAALAAFAARTFPDACPPSLPRSEIDAFIARNLSPAQFAAWLADPCVRVFVAEAALSASSAAEPVIVGYAVSIHGDHAEGPEQWAGSRTAYLSKLYIDRTQRGAGLASRLLGAAITAACADACAALWLGVSDANARARAFYAKSGLSVVGRRPFTVGSLHFTDDVFAVGLADVG